MKTLTEYIIERSLKGVKESFNADTNIVTLKDLVVKYTGPIEIRIQVPVSYMEDDVQIYIEDTILNQLPGGNECDSTKLFGDNIDNINDTHFELNEMSFEENNNTNNTNNIILWDKSYSPKNNTEDMKTAIVKNILYIIEFSEFSISGVTEKNYKDKLEQILQDTVSETYKYPIELTFNNSNITYKY